MEETAYKETAPPSKSSSEFSLSTASYVHTNISNWRENSSMKIIFSGGNICLDFDATKSWPTAEIRHTSGKHNIKVNSNPWVFVKRQDGWVGGTWEWMVSGDTCKPMSSVAGDHIKVSPLTDWRPKSGEELYFMASSIDRGASLNKYRASNLALVFDRVSC